jgi:glycosyltransferase involved in cell wall biosynthesis
MLYLARELPRPDFDVRFILMAERGNLALEAEAAGVTVHTLGIDPELCREGIFRCLLRLNHALWMYRTLARDVDVVDAWLVPSYTFAGLAKPLTRAPVLIAGRRSTLDVARTRSRMREAAGRIAMRSVDAVVANSSAAARQAIEQEGIEASKVHVIHNGVEVPHPSEVDRRSLRDRWGYDDGHVVVGCVGVLRPGKGHDLLLEAAATVRHEAKDVRFVLVGDGPLRSSLEEQIERLHIGSIVRLLGTEEDARLVYAGFDICVQSSDSEGLPNVVLEAAAAGLAIVATDVGGTSEVITSGVDGILVAKRNRDAIASAIVSLAGDPGLRQRLGAAARQRARFFSTARLTAETADLYRALSGRA